MNLFVKSLLLTSVFLLSLISLANGVKKQPWAILVVGLNDYKFSFPMEGTVYKMWNLLCDRGIPPKNIIVISPHVAPWASKNPTPGFVPYATKNPDYFNNNSSRNYYDNVVVDYDGITLKTENFYNILKGNKSDPALKEVGNGKVLESGPGDNVFLYYVGIGAYGVSSLYSGALFFAEDFIPLIENLKVEKRFNKLFILWESAFSGSNFDDYLDSASRNKIFVHSFGGRYNRMSVCHYNEYLEAFTSTCAGYTYNKYLDEMFLSKNAKNERIFDAFCNAALLETNEKMVHNLYGDPHMGSNTLYSFMGETNTFSSDKKMDLENLKIIAAKETRSGLNLDQLVAQDENISHEEKTQITKAMNNIVRHSIEGTRISWNDVRKPMKKLPRNGNESKCYKNTLLAIKSKCFTEKTISLFFFRSDLPASLCRFNIEEKKIQKAIEEFC